jgi:hypothetical protein
MAAKLLLLIRSDGRGFPETEINQDETAILTAEKGENRRTYKNCVLFLTVR